MKKYITIAMCLVGIVTIQAQTTFGLKLSEVSNDGQNYVVKIAMQMDGNVPEDFKLGSSSLQFNFPNEVISNPELVSTTLDSPSIYIEPTVTVPLPNLCSFNIELNVPSLPQNMEIAPAPAWTELCQISFTIDNNTTIEPLAWSYNGGSTRTVVYLDDEATQIYVGNIEEDLMFESQAATNIEKVTLENSFTILPNPMTDFTNITIDYSKAKGQNLSYKLVNSLGKVIMYNEVKTNEQMITIKRKDLAKGIYHFVLLSQGQILESAKVVMI